MKRNNYQTKHTIYLNYFDNNKIIKNNMDEKLTQLRLLVTMLLLVTAMAMPKMAWAEITPTKPSSGDGSSANPYQISTAGELYWFAALVNGKLTDGTALNTSANAVLVNDITVNTGVLTADGKLASDVSGFRVWTPIGKNNIYKIYEGTFDGQGHTVRGLYFNNSNTACVGLFGFIGSGAKISNVGVVDSYFNGYYYVGGVCGYNKSGTISNCYHIGVVKGKDDKVGGVCGNNVSESSTSTIKFIKWLYTVF